MFVIHFLAWHQSHLVSVTTAVILHLMTAILPFSECTAENVRVLVWDERQPDQKLGYDGNFLGDTIAAHLATQPGITVVSVSIDSPAQGLDQTRLDATDVVIWWGHRRHGEVSDEASNRLVQGVLSGHFSLIVLHSAHFAKPFMALMDERAKADAHAMIPAAERAGALTDFNTPLRRGSAGRGATLSPAVEKVDGVWRLVQPACVFPDWRADGKPSVVSVIAPDHPVARGLPREWTIPQTEMYNEPFHVPEPDSVVLEERWKTGEYFRSGCIWNIGKGRLFYFRPGHETYPIFRQNENLLVVENAVRWLKPPNR
jgi:trehalose utilization protein